MPTSIEWFERARRSIPGGVNSPVRAFKSVGGEPFFTVRAEGPYLHTADGRRLIDFVGTWGPAIHGHNDPHIREAITTALSAGTSFGTPHPGEVVMAERILEWVPSVEQVRLCNSGTEATMSALRLARGFTGRDKIVKFEGCYHGHSDGLLVAAGSGALTLGKPDSAGVPAAVAGQTIVLPFNDTDAIDACFEQMGDGIAAVIVEPYPANCGLILPRPGFLEHLREKTRETGTVLIFDEVMTGFRLGRAGVQGLTGIVPDLSAFGKVIGGGLPVGAFGGKREIMQLLAPEGPVYQAGTLSGNPLAVAAGLASLDKLESTGAYDALEARGRLMKQTFEEWSRERSVPLTVHQTGSMFSLFFTGDPVHSVTDVQSSDTSRFRRFFHACLEERVYLPPSPYEACFLSTAHSEAVLSEALEAMERAFEKLA